MDLKVFVVVLEDFPFGHAGMLLPTGHTEKEAQDILAKLSKQKCTNTWTSASSMVKSPPHHSKEIQSIHCHREDGGPLGMVQLKINPHIHLI